MILTVEKKTDGKYATHIIYTTAAGNPVDIVMVSHSEGVEEVIRVLTDGWLEDEGLKPWE